jgi:hypothetical protein
MAASDYVPIFFKNRLHLAGRPQMSTRPRWRAEGKWLYFRPGSDSNHTKVSEMAEAGSHDATADRVQSFLSGDELPAPEQKRGASGS